MKIRFDIDCSPEEARAFLGLPDVSAVQREMMETLRERLLANIQSMDVERLFKTWMPSGADGWEQTIKNFGNQAGTKKDK